MNTTAIATHLNIAQAAIVKIEEWASVLFVVAKGVGGRFVSKKINVKEKKMTKTQITHKEAARQLSNQIGGKLWLKKDDEARLYIGKGYLRFAPETDNSAQIQYYLKSYDRTDVIAKAVDDFNSKFQIVVEASSPKDWELSDFVSDAENEVYSGYGI